MDVGKTRVKKLEKKYQKIYTEWSIERLINDKQKEGFARYKG